MTLTLDFTLSFDHQIKAGVRTQNFNSSEMSSKAVSAFKNVMKRVVSKELGFWTLSAENHERLIKEATNDAKEFDTLVVLGIGGSSLGGITLLDALAPDANVIFFDNVDSESFERRLNQLNLEKCLFNVISKSGGTVETAAQFCIIRDRLIRQFGMEGYQKRMIATTDPQDGILRQIVKDEGLRSFEVPSNVGGRFSVFTSVGLYPAAFAGIDVNALLSGAAAMQKQSENESYQDNPALFLAALLFQATEQGLSTHVLMPYVDRLASLSDWFVQLWAESLGKKVNQQGENVHCGPLPHGAKGSTDQHSQVQLFVEGPVDKIVLFVGVDSHETGSPFPENMPVAYSYLKGHDLGTLLKAEREGTALALAQAGRPSALIQLDHLSAENMGKILFLFQACTAFAGEFWEVNAFDQPGVEAGKLIAYAKMGREGYSHVLKDFTAFENNSDSKLFDC